MYQVFEKRPDGHKEIHNFRYKKDATKKQKELEKAGHSDGEIWNTQDNSMSKFLRF